MMGPWNGAHWAFAVKAYYKNNDGYVSAQHVFRNHFNIPRNDPMPSAHAIKTWTKNFKEMGSTLKKQIGSVKGCIRQKMLPEWRVLYKEVLPVQLVGTQWHLAFLIA
jgi:hypothetical protein